MSECQDNEGRLCRVHFPITHEDAMGWELETATQITRDSQPTMLVPITKLES